MSRTAALLLALAAASAATAQVRVLDDFETVEAWTAVPADGVSVGLSQDAGLAGRALRMDVDFHGGAGYAIARRDVALSLPETYRLRLWLRAEAAGGGPAPVNDLELKLVGASGEDVWWHHRRRFAYPTAWTPLDTRTRHVTFAWGPSGGGTLRDVSAIEIAVTAQEGGALTVWLDSLTVEALPPERPYAGTPTAAAAYSPDAQRAIDGDPETRWLASDRFDTLTVDFGEPRTVGGLVLDWALGPADYDVETSDDGQTWTRSYAVRGLAWPEGHLRSGHNGFGPRPDRDYVPLGEVEARFVRLSRFEMLAALSELTVEPVGFAETPNALFARIAADAPRGHYPRYFLGEASYWTVVGAPGAEREALVSEDGAVEVASGAFSLEPFFQTNTARSGINRLHTWATADSTVQTLAGGALPIPTTTRYHGGVALSVTAFAAEPPDGLAVAPDSLPLVVRYRLVNIGPDDEAVRFTVALRPFAVNPAYQFLSAPSGAVGLRRVDVAEGGRVRADGVTVVPSEAPWGAAALPFDAGTGLGRLGGGLPSVDDPQGFASAGTVWWATLAPGAEWEVALTVWPGAPGAPLDAAREQARAEAAWAARLGPFRLDGPPEVRALADAVRAQVGYVLVNRDGAAVQPGSRAYDRSWIRDGALTSAALLRVGLSDVATDFARWYAPFQYANGKVPCCVDTRGADPVPEHDSHGELVYLAAETYRYTRDRAFLRAMWPHVRGAVAFMDSLRATTRGPAFDTDSTRHLRGLLPPSISHEGYSARPAYSYWDDLFALRGYRDAVFIAETLGEPTAALAASRDAFTADFAASVRATLEVHDLTTLPGAADLGDFDATSTSIALDPVSAGDVLPPAALRATFEQYGRNVETRAAGDEWDAYTPYEWRNVGALLRLGEAERAHEAVRWFMQHRRPAGWQHWAEVVWRDERAPRFIGDMPHTWVGSDMLRATLDLFGYTEGAPGAERVVVGAGVPLRWVAWPDGVAVRGLVTPGGDLAYRVTGIGGRAAAYRFEALPEIPPGGIEVRGPFDATFVRAEVDGEPAALHGGAVLLRAPAQRVAFFME